MVPPTTPEPHLRGVFANAGLKLASLGFATALYAIVHGTEDTQQTFAVPLVARLPSTELILADPLPATLQVSLRGPRAKLRDLRAEGIPPLVVEVNAATSARIELEGSALDLPAGVRVEGLEPSEISLHWERPLVRAVPVKLVFGPTPPGLVLETPPTVAPSSVAVRGLARRLEVLQAVPTEVLELAHAQRGPIERRVALVVPDGLLAVEPSSVTARLSLREATSVQSFARVPVTVVGAAHAKTQPAAVAVRFECPSEGRLPARVEDVVAFVRASDAQVDLADVQVEHGVCRVEVVPARVIVRR